MSQPSVVSQSPRVAGPGSVSGRITSLDALRGMAAIAVILFHCTINPYPRGMLANGWIGVDLFFVLSGFLITGQLIDSRGKDGYFFGFYARRTLRIFPLYYAFLLAMAVIGKHAWWNWAYLTNVAAVAHGWAWLGGFQPLWSLSVEEQFYLVWPVLVFVTTNRGLAATSVVCIVGAYCFRALALTHGASFLASPSIAAYVLLPARVDTLAVGSLLALVVRNPAADAWLRKLWPIALLVSIVILLAIGFPLGQYSANTQGLGYPALAVLFALLIRGAVALPNRLRSLAFFGKYSYAMYLVHLPVLAAFVKLFPARFLHPRGIVDTFILIVLVMVVTTLVSMASYVLVESPFLRLKHRVTGLPRRGVVRLPAEDSVAS